MRFWIVAFLAASALAQPPLQFAEIRDLRLASGRTVGSCRLGYRTYGQLDAARSNAVLFPTWFTGSSAQLDGFVGPDRLADPSRFFVITVDAPGNGVSCSPSNAGEALRELSIADMVEAERRLVAEHLGLKTLHAVIGISMGGMQAFEWITAHPDMVRAAVPIVGSPRLSASDVLLWSAELKAIEAVERAGGDPRDAMPAVRMLHEFALTSPAWIHRSRPRADLAQWLKQIEEDSRKGMDPRDYAAQLRAMIGHDVTRRFGGSLEKAAAAVRARVLVVAAEQDHMVNPLPALEMAAVGGFDVLRLKTDCGHMATRCEDARIAAAVRDFLATGR
ncbi:MAG: alpha/beta fold hydrolase [Bryobacteraceae bacterium]|nr:alpha/beta fold hydrolase [Bryobacteraceae bacterium]